MSILTIKQVCETLQISKTTAYKLSKEAGSPFFKLNKKYLVVDVDLIAWLKKRKAEV